LKSKNHAPAWTDAFRSSRTRCTKRLSLPLTCLAVAGTLFPWSRTSFDTVSRADEIAVPSVAAAAGTAAPADATNVPALNAESTAPSAVEHAAAVIQSLPIFPSMPQATSGAPAASVTTSAPDATRNLKIRLISAGKIRQATVALSPRVLTVGAALEAMNVKVDTLDRVTPTAEKPAYNGMTIRLVRVEARVVKRTTPVAHETRYQPTAAIARGTKQVIENGQSGLLEITERAWFKDGKATRREFISQRLVRKPKNAVVALGTRRQYLPGRIPYHNRYARAYGLASRSGSPRDRMMVPQYVAPASPKTFRAVKSIILTATGYSPDPSENGGYTTTATGLPIGYGAAAVDPRVIPLGTKMYVEGYGYAFACDTGGAIKGHRIDLAYDSYGVANSKGRKKVRVWILAN
jgi:3D (Asp-Asp-Asp) domain-containing protein